MLFDDFEFNSFLKFFSEIIKLINREYLATCQKYLKNKNNPIVVLVPKQKLFYKISSLKFDLHEFDKLTIHE